MIDGGRIETPRLRLRPFEDRDVESLHDMLSDETLMTWWSRGPTRDIGETRAYLTRERAPAWRWWMVTRAGEDRAIGWVSAGEKRQGGVTEIGYILAREAIGRGIAREAVAAVVSRLFAEGQRRVFADTDPDNARSIRLLEGLGFRREGRLRGEWETHIGVRDSLILGLLAEEWVAPSS